MVTLSTYNIHFYRVVGLSSQSINDLEEFWIHLFQRRYEIWE